MNEKDFERIENTLRELTLFIHNLAKQEAQKKDARKQRLLNFDYNSKTRDLILEKMGFPDYTPSELAEQEQVERQRVQRLKLFGELQESALVVSHKEDSQMNIHIPGISINSKPRKDGRYQGYITDRGVRCYAYANTPEEVARKLKYFLQHGIPKKKKTAKANSFNGVPTRFTDFAMYYFENFRKKKVTAQTYKIDLRRFKRNLEPYFKQKPLNKISPLECQKLLDKLVSEEKGKTADEVRALMSVIFKMAIKHGILSMNPLDVIYFEQHERVSGKALTVDEERQLKATYEDTPYLPQFMIMLFTGLRPNELPTARIEGKFIIAVNSKRKNKRVQYKKIPIFKALAPYIANGMPEIFNYCTLFKAFKKALPNHKYYDLRTTFSTRLIQYNVEDAAYKEFMGHSSGKLKDAYTDLPDEYLLKEGSKMDAWQI